MKVSLSQQEALKDATLGLKTAIYGLIAGVAALALAMGAQALFKGQKPSLKNCKRLNQRKRKQPYRLTEKQPRTRATHLRASKLILMDW